MAIELLDPKEVAVASQDGEEKTYLVSKFPADPGMELVVEVACIAGGLATNNPNPASMIAIIDKALSYAAVPGANGDPIPLTTAALRKSHIPDWEAKLALFFEVAKHNVGFFRNGRASGSFGMLARILSQKTTGTSMESLAQSFLRGAQPSAS
jgi:hypothetical protein